EIKVKMAAVAYSKEDHDAARSKVEELQPFNERYHKLEGADSHLASVLDALARDSTSLAKWEKEQEKDRSEIAVLEPQVEAPVGARGHTSSQEVGALLSEKQAETIALDKAVTELVGKRGDLRGK